MHLAKDPAGPGFDLAPEESHDIENSPPTIAAEWARYIELHIGLRVDIGQALGYRIDRFIRQLAYRGWLAVAPP